MRTFSTSFIKKFREVVKDFYHYKEEGPFLVVPTLSGKRVLVYLPIISYTDLFLQEARQLAQNFSHFSYQIRVLDFEQSEFLQNEPVTMRLYIDKNRDIISHYKSRTSTTVRKA